MSQHEAVWLEQGAVLTEKGTSSIPHNICSALPWLGAGIPGMQGEHADFQSRQSTGRSVTDMFCYHAAGGVRETWECIT